MTLQELIEKLQALPQSAREARVVIISYETDEDGTYDDVGDVSYDRGEVLIEPE